MLLRVLLLLLVCTSAWAKPAIETVIPGKVSSSHDTEVMMRVKDGINSQFIVMPGGPFVTRTLPFPYRIYDMAVHEGFSFLAAGTRGLLIADIAGANRLKVVGGYSTQHNVTRVAVENDQAWLVNDENEVVALHIGNLAKPVVLGRYRASQPIADIVVRDSHMYLLLGCSRHSAMSTDAQVPRAQATACVEQANIVIVDMRTPETPLELSRYTFNEPALKIVVQGNYIYVAQPASGLTIIDVTDKLRPVQAGNYDVTGGAITVAVQGNVALMARGIGGIAALNVSDPAHIQWFGSHGRLGRVEGIITNAQQALVWNDRDEIITLDISKPALLSITASHRDSAAQECASAASAGCAGAAAHVAAVWLDDKTVVAATSSAVQIVDFSATPPLFSNENLDVGQGVNFGGERRLFIGGDIAYVTDWFSGLHLYDISNPSRPRLLSSFHTPGSAKGVVVRDGYAFIADDDHGLQVVDVRDPSRPTHVAGVATNGLAYTPKLAGDFLYLASHRGGFQIIDVSDVRSPKMVADVDTPGKSWSLDVAGNTLFVADDTSGVLVFDVTDPKQPKQIGVFSPGGAVEDVVIRGNTAYAAFFDQGFYVLDITNPAEPRKIGHTLTPGNARAIELKDHLAYVTDWFAGVQVIDVSNETAPVIVGGYDTRGAAWGIGIKGNYAYIGDWWGGFSVLDISNPKAPALADTYHIRGPVLEIVAQGKFAYAAIENGGVQVFDITNPLNPTWMTGIEVDGAIGGLLLDGNTLYITVSTGNDAGLVLVDISNPFQIRRTTSLAIAGGVQRARIGAGRLYFINVAGLGVMDLSNIARHGKITDCSRDAAMRREQSQETIITNPPSCTHYTVKANDLWIDDKHIYLATDQGMDVLDMHLNVKMQYKIVREATLVRAHGNAVFLYVAGLGIRVLDISGNAVRPVSLFEPGEPLSDLALEDGVLYATGQRANLLAIDIENLARLKIQGIYPLTRPATGIKIINNTALLAGHDIIISVKLFPLAVITRRDKKEVRLTLPKGMPAGTYHAVNIAPSGKRSIGYNMLNIEIPRFSKPKITPEEFQRLLQEQKKKIQPGAQ